MHRSGYLVELCHVFPSLSPWNIDDLEVRFYLAFTAAIDARRAEAEEARRGG